MATTAQIAAAVANAQLSTGPRSPEGKAVSSRNATKFGLYARAIALPGEDPADFEDLLQQFDREFSPNDDPIGVTLIQNLVCAVWLQRRYLRIEAEVVNTCAATLEPGPNPLGQIYLNDATGAKILDRIFRRRQAAERQFNRALTDLRTWRQSRPDPVTAPPIDVQPSNPVRFEKLPAPARPASSAPAQAPGAPRQIPPCSTALAGNPAPAPFSSPAVSQR